MVAYSGQCIWVEGENMKASDPGRSYLGGERGVSKDRQGRNMWPVLGQVQLPPLDMGLWPLVMAPV